jgi:integrase
MASLQNRNGSWRILFRYRQIQYTYTLGDVSEMEAHATAAKINYVLMRLKQNLLNIPPGMDIVTFIQQDGKLPPDTPPPKKETTFKQAKDSYLKTVANGSMEENTLYTARIHLNHFEATLGKRFPFGTLMLPHLQRHIDRRAKSVSGVTIKKEIDTLRSVWNWAQRMGKVDDNFPSGKLLYPKTDEKLPFMLWKEIERRIAAGGNADDLWECLYLTVPEVSEFLACVKGRKAPPWVYLMFAFAAHTGARRSEMIRARLEDVDLAEGVVTIREKKRTQGKRTTRRVPLSSTLQEILKDWTERQTGKTFLFGKGIKQLSPQATQHAFERVLHGTKWEVVTGWHCLRHSFISALASRGVDQRFIDDFVGHQTEEQRRRYRHLYPSTQKEAIRLVFG